jgi:hypothetical protein
MARQGEVHVVKADGWWRVETEDMTLAETSSQTEAIRAAQAIAQEHRRALLIHDLDGQIREVRTNGGNPNAATA